MSDIVVVESSDQNSNILIVESTNEDSVITLEQNTVIVEIINTEKILASDLPDDISIAKIEFGQFGSGFDGLDAYLDQYNFDCGSP